MSIELYVREVNRLVRTGVHNEHPFREALSALLRSSGRTVTVINDPGQTEHGNPDFHVLRSGVRIGFVETKALSIDLDSFERTDQFRRYLAGFGNLVVTNYAEFRWYVNHAAEPNLTTTLRNSGRGADLTLSPENGPGLVRLLRAFVEYEIAQARTAIELAAQLAAQARTIRDVVAGILARHDEDEMLQQQLRAFRTVLIPDLTVPDFADMYAQTIAYGLFAARCAHPDERNFDRLTAPQMLPLSNPFLGNVFDDIAGRNLDARLRHLVDRLCLLLRTTDVHSFIANFGLQTGPDDPIVHFYETFLKEYDADVRRDRGVFYTPGPVVSFIVRSVDQILKSDFNISAGLADRTAIRRGADTFHRLQILDPATGTGTFLLGIVDHVSQSFNSQRGLWQSYVRDHLLPRLHGFELLMAPYTIAHLKIGLALARDGFQFRRNERVSIYLTNSLEDTSRVTRRLPFENFLTQEASEANRIKQDTPLMVVIGNPPYSVRSGNLGPHARRLVERYKEIDGQRIREGGTLAVQRVIENDYVKFVSFAQEQIERTGEGVVGLITANSYLDSPVLAGFRQSLVKSFDLVHIIDLHGYARSSADGDQNIFPQIGEGVAIMLLARFAGDRERQAEVRYSSYRGSRAEKRTWLDTYDVASIAFEPARPQTPDYQFRPENQARRGRYMTDFISLDEVFEMRRGAIVTARDGFVVGFDETEVIQRIEAFRDHPGSLQEASEAVGANWRGDWARGMGRDAKTWLRTANHLSSYVQKIMYRPFDIRYIFYEDHFLDTPTHAVMDNITSGNNLALLYGRSVRYGVPDHFFVTNILAEAKCAEASRQCYAAHLFAEHGGLVRERVPNFKREFVEMAARRWGMGEFSAEEIFRYIYAVLYSNAYRREYADLICRDVARLPLVGDVAMVRGLANCGGELIRLHTRPNEASIVTTFDIDSESCVVERSGNRWTMEGDRVFRLHLNEEQFIGRVPEEVVACRIGGYPVIEKWIGAREGRELDVDDIQYLQHVISALSRTTEVVAQIDELLGESV